METTEERKIYYAAIPFDTLKSAKEILEQIGEKLHYSGWIIKETKNYVTVKTYQESTYKRV